MKNSYFITLLFVFLTAFFNSFTAIAQNDSTYMRIAKIKVDSTLVDQYIVALKEGIENAVLREPGVLSLYAMQEKEDPTSITVFEIYASREAYNTHIETTHFLKYKNTVQEMVRSLELIDVEPIVMESKSN